VTHVIIDLQPALPDANDLILAAEAVRHGHPLPIPPELMIAALVREIFQLRAELGR
jgi:hypothetical protein